MQYYYRIGTLYCEAIQEYLTSLEPQQGEDESEFERHVQDMHMIFHLARVLYVPEDGSGVGVVGEELLHWLNAHDVAPTTEQGQQIAQTIPPHQHPDYWDYVLRCVLRGFYGTAATVLQSYVDAPESPTLQSIAAETVHMLQTVPRSTSFSTEQSFLSAHRHWHTSLRIFLSSIQRKMDSVESELHQSSMPSSSDVRLELEAQFRCLYELLCGVEDRVLEFAEDWKEALCAWGVLVSPSMKRDDVPETVQHITASLQVDETLARETILSHLTRGDLVKALKQCTNFDLWIAAHLGDYFCKTQVLEEPQMLPDILMTWADTLLEEERLWRMALSYLDAIHTTEARDKMRSILFSVPLFGRNESDDFTKVEEVLSACIEYGMDDEVRIICRRLADALLKQQKYGVAIAYSVRARDARQVQAIADHMLNDYVTHGAEHYMESVDSVPRKLLEDVLQEEQMGVTPFATSSSIFSSQTFAPLVFHIKYHDFHQLFSQHNTWREAAQLLVGLLTSDVTPASFLSVLLVDALPLLQSTTTLFFTLPEAYELLRVAEMVTSVEGDQADLYFYWLEQLLVNADHDETSRRKLANERMLVVRLALSQYMSRIVIESDSSL